jgi:peptidoglycan L-alanyl-D-glutamate endopeptidase CwlK
MTITLGSRSLQRLEGVHPDLVRVVRRAALISAHDFTVIEGIRSKEQMWTNYGKGRTVAMLAAKGVPSQYAKPNDAKVTWLNDPLMSNHRQRADGYGRAVDLCPFPIDWNDIGRFRVLMETMEKAADDEDVNISAGGRWRKADWPHFELA